MKTMPNSRRVLGIDPGFDRLGLAILSGTGSKPEYVWSDCILPPKGTASERLAQVHLAIEDVIEKYDPHVVALETLFFSTNKKTALSVAEARGAVLTVCGLKGLVVLEFSPGQVKLAVTGYGSADKLAIARMLPRLLTLPSKKRLDDELDAIAIAIAGLSHNIPR